MMKFIRHFCGLALAVILIVFLDNSWSALPPLGKLFSPFTGFHQNATSKYDERDETLDIPGLLETVVIKYDDNGVPHIFAKNDHDLYLAQGYVVARDRLWQMEFYTLVASGRLSEVVGKAALEFDRYNRRIGMARTAARLQDSLARDSISMLMLDAYAKGVNVYINSLDRRALPVEYKILNYAPEPWSPYKSLLMLMNLRNTLNGGSHDYRLSNVLAMYGDSVVQDLFPFYPTVESPIIPEGTPWNFTPVGTPPVPETVSASLQEGSLAMLSIPEAKPQIGSNNWVVGGSRSATGLPILANDPHLQLTLPSIWYQVQLTTPEVNVYGVTMPGAPAVVIGFNKDVAWGVTNVGSDVMDFYKITFQDETKRHYLHDGVWKEVVLRVDTFGIRGQKALVDTVYYTHHGPIVNNETAESNFNKSVPAGYAMRWITHETQGSEIRALHLLNRARTYDDYRAAIAYFRAPAQNFVFASNTNDIAITANGQFPLKWKGQGRFLLDGALPSHDWQGWIPFEHNPTAKNPRQDFLSSANQFPTDPSYPYYLNWRFAHPSRAIRINERLASMTRATADSLRSLLNDNFNVDARRVLPLLLQSLQSVDSIRNMPEFGVVSQWNYQNAAHEIGASIFEEWAGAKGTLYQSIWADDFPADDYLLPPTTDRTLTLIENERDSPWFDDRRTQDRVETADDIIRASFVEAVERLRRRYGPLDPTSWNWANVKATSIAHLVPAFTSFSRHHIAIGGGESIVNATSATHGPSWRMVVQLDNNWPKAYGLYPGGQSGNPGSTHYDNMIDAWSKGELNELLFLKDEHDRPSLLNYTITLNP